MAEEGPMAQISLAGSEGVLKGETGGEQHKGGGREERRDDEHKDRGSQTVKQRNEICYVAFVLMRKFGKRCVCVLVCLPLVC